MGYLDSDGNGTVALYYGGPSGASAAPATTFVGGWHFGNEDGYSLPAFASAGDVNGDGYADIAIGASWQHSVYIYLGGPNGVSTTPATTLVGSDTSGMGYSAANAGDVNGDTYGDLIVWNASLPGASVYYGSPSGLVTTSPGSVLTPAPCNVGGVTGGGDVNGDGYADVLVTGFATPGTWFSNRVYVFHGGPNGVSSTPTTVLGLFTDDTKSEFGNLMTALDVNGDGYWDVAVGAADINRVYMFMGSPSGVNPTYVAELNNGAEQGRFGHGLSGADTDRDGYEDLVVGAACASFDGHVDGCGSAYHFPGSPGGVVTTPSVTLRALLQTFFFGREVSLSASGS
jgi:hypothetical protein